MVCEHRWTRTQFQGSTKISRGHRTASGADSIDWAWCCTCVEQIQFYFKGDEVRSIWEVWHVDQECCTPGDYFDLWGVLPPEPPWRSDFLQNHKCSHSSLVSCIFKLLHPIQLPPLSERTALLCQSWHSWSLYRRSWRWKSCAAYQSQTGTGRAQNFQPFLSSKLIQEVSLLEGLQGRKHRIWLTKPTRILMTNIILLMSFTKFLLLILYY